MHRVSVEDCLHANGGVTEEHQVAGGRRMYYSKYLWG